MNPTLAPPRRPVGRPKKNPAASDTDNSSSFLNDSFEFDQNTKPSRGNSKKKLVLSPHPGNQGLIYTPSNKGMGSLTSTPFSLNLSEISPNFFNGMTPYNGSGDGSLLFNEFDVTPSLFRTPGILNSANIQSANGTSYASGNKLKRKEHLIQPPSSQQPTTGTQINNNSQIQSTPTLYNSLSVLAESAMASAEKEQLLSLLSSGNGKNTLSFASRSCSNDENDEHALNLSRISKSDPNCDQTDFADGLSILHTSPKKMKNNETMNNSQTDNMMSPMPSSSIDGNNFTPFFQYLGEFSGNSIPFDRTNSTKKDANTTTIKRKYGQLNRPDENILSFADRIEAVAHSSPSEKLQINTRYSHSFYDHNFIL